MHGDQELPSDPYDAAIVLLAREVSRLRATGRRTAARRLCDVTRSILAAGHAADGQPSVKGRCRQRLIELMAGYRRIEVEALHDLMREAGYSTAVLDNPHAVLDVLRRLERLGEIEGLEFEPDDGRSAAQRLAAVTMGLN